MYPLATRLERAGFLPCRFGYPTRATPAANAARLADWLAARPEPPRHFVAHSLGGVVLAHLFERHPETVPSDGRIVLLGSPMRGSGVARRLAKTGLGRRLLAGSLVEGLDGKAPAWQAPRTLMIAGTRPIGPGRLVPGALKGRNDGTVAVDETRVPGLAAHLCLPVNHFGMLFSRSVAEATIAFLTD